MTNMQTATIIEFERSIILFQDYSVIIDWHIKKVVWLYMYYCENDEYICILIDVRNVRKYINSICSLSLCTRDRVDELL